MSNLRNIWQQFIIAIGEVQSSGNGEVREHDHRWRNIFQGRDGLPGRDGRDGPQGFPGKTGEKDLTTPETPDIQRASSLTKQYFFPEKPIKILIFSTHKYKYENGVYWYPMWMVKRYYKWTMYGLIN